MIPSYKNSTKAEKIIGWVLLILMILGWLAFITQPASPCVADPFYTNSCSE